VNRHGIIHQHRALIQEADGRGMPGHCLPLKEDPVYSRGPHQVRPGRLQGPGRATR
jgi:hypothetical protein